MKKTLKILFVALLAVVCSLCAIACDGGSSGPNDPVYDYSLNKTAMNLEVGEQDTLTVSVTPAKQFTASYNSGAESVATVDNAGKVTAVSAGTAVITVTVDDVQLTCAVTVREKQPTTPAIDVIDGYEGKFEVPSTTAYGAAPDLDNVIIDGKLDDELWQDKKWYTQFKTQNPSLKFEVTTAMSDGGLYIAARSDDRYLFFNGRNKFYYNTHIAFNVYGNSTYSFKVDTNNTQPMTSPINVRSYYKGKINALGEGEGLYVEAYISWSELGMTGPEEINMLPIYYWTVRARSAPTAMYPTFVNTAGDGPQTPKFGPDGYTGGDEEGATVGSHQTGLGKTNGWKVENAGQENETITNLSTGSNRNFMHAAFFREMYSNRFMMTTRVTVNGNSGFTRAGLLMYVDNLSYRAFAVELNDDILTNGVLKTLPVRAYTNYPSNITVTTKIGNVTPDTQDGRKTNQFDLTVFSNNGMIYYLVNGNFVYSEEASYIKNAYGGFYAYNSDVTFSDYSFKTFAKEAEINAEISKYCYTAQIEDGNPNGLKGSLSQIATSNDGTGDLAVYLDFNIGRQLTNQYMGYELSEFYYEYQDENGALKKVDLMEDAKNNSVSGVYTIRNVPGNITIHTNAKERMYNADELVSLKLQMWDVQLINGVAAVDILLEGSGPFSRYSVLENHGEGYVEIMVPKGQSWKYTATKTGYRVTSGDIAEGLILNDNMTNYQRVNMNGAVVGGEASAVLGPNGNPVSSLTYASAPGGYWDLNDEENSKVTFTSTDTGSSVIYYSGRTISDYQVAYVEITNQTDYMAFQSIEDDPAVGFNIATSGSQVFCGLWKTGVRILPTSNWSDCISKGGMCGWTGGIASIDRSNNGRVLGVSLGTGTVNRVPYNNTTYTTSFLMIRKGGNVYLYAADGRAGVKPDGTNFDKMIPFYSDYFSTATGYAALGFRITVSYNLRLDFENYWILAGDEQAGAFADSIISTDLTVEGSDLVKLESDGLTKYDAATGVGKLARSSELNITAANPLPAGKIIKLTMGDGKTSYINSNSAKGTLSIGANVSSAVHIKAEMVDAIKVTGSLSAPEGVVVGNKEGVVLNDKGEEVASFKTDGQGVFSVLVEKSKKFNLRVNISGYAMNPISVNDFADRNVGEVQFERLTFGSKVGSLTTNDGMEFGIDDKYHGAYAHWETSTVGDAALTINPEYNNMTDFVLSFSYVRSSASENGVSVKDEADIGLGVIVNGDDMSGVHVLNIGNGYRILRDGGWGTKIEARGVGAVNFAAASVPLSRYVQVKIVKSAGTFYLFSKYSDQSSYKLSLAWDAVSSSGTPILAGSVTFAIKMTVTAGTYLNMTFFDIDVKELSAQSAPEIISTVNVNQSEGGTISVDGQSSDTFTIIGAKALSLTVRPESEKKLVGLYVDGVAQSLGDYTDGIFTGTVTVKGNAVITAEYDWVCYAYTITDIKIKELNTLAVKITNGTTTRTFSVSALASQLSESVAVLDSGSRKLTILAPKGTWTVTLYSDTKATQEVGSRTITVA